MVDYDGVTRTYNAANQMTNDGTNALTYDYNGNLTGNGTDTYTWDRANRLSSVGNHSYVYDGLGNRVQQTVSSVMTDYLNDVQPGLTKLLKQTTGVNVEQFVHAPRGIHAVDDGTDWNFYMQDGLGSVRAMVDDTAVVQSSMSFDPYGNPMAAYGAGFGFTGEQTDANGSVFLRARYYEPSLGVFNALDPLEGKTCTPMTLNGYSWVQGNVPNMVDPSGKRGFRVELNDGGAYFRQLKALEQAMRIPNLFVIKGFNSGFCSSSSGGSSQNSKNLSKRLSGSGDSDVLQGRGWCNLPWVNCDSTPTQVPTPTPMPTATQEATLSEYDVCEQTLMTIAVLNEAGANSTAEMYSNLSHLIVNGLCAGWASVETMIDRSYVGGSGLLTEPDPDSDDGARRRIPFTCNSQLTTIGEFIEDFWRGHFGSASYDLAATQVRAAYSRRSTCSSSGDPTNGSRFFLISENLSLAQSQRDVMEAMRDNRACADAWAEQYPNNATAYRADIEPFVKYIEANGIALRYANFIDIHRLDDPNNGIENINECQET